MLHLIIFIALLISKISAYAVTPSAELTRYLSSIQTMQADFTQTINDKNKLIQQATGHLALQRPGKFRWKVTKPTTQLIIANGSRLWVYDPDLEQVTIRLLNKEIGSTPALLLSRPDIAIEKNFTVQTIKNAASLQWFTLLPKNRDNMLAFIKMGFAQGQLREMDLQDHLGHNTVVEFYHVILNQPLSPSLFHFTVPAHTDVIDETGQQ